MTPDPVDEGWGAEHIRDPELLDRAHDIHRVHLRRARRIHLGNNRRHAERGTEQCEQWKGRQIHLARLDVIELADLGYLRAKNLMRVDGSLWCPGAAAGEKYRSGLVSRGFDGGVRLVGGDAFAQIAQRVSKPEPLCAHRYLDSNAVARPPQQGARRVRLGNSDERFRLRVRKTAVEIAHADARIDQYRDGAGFEKRKGEGEEIRARRHHQCCPDAAPYADTVETAGNTIAAFFQLAKRELLVGDAAVSVPPVRADNRRT